MQRPGRRPGRLPAVRVRRRRLQLRQHPVLRLDRQHPPQQAGGGARPLTHDGGGYWEVASDGGIFAFGDAGFYGSMGGKPLNAPIVGMAATPDGGGYWLVASDGGIFNFGDASFFGSTGSIHLNRPDRRAWPRHRRRRLLARGVRRRHLQLRRRQVLRLHGRQAAELSPIVGMAADAQTGGYWEVAADGGIFSFDAPFYGSTGSIRLNAPIVGMEASAGRRGLPLRGVRRRHLHLQRPLLRVDGRQAAEQAGRRHGGDLTPTVRSRQRLRASLRSRLSRTAWRATRPPKQYRTSARPSSPSRRRDRAHSGRSLTVSGHLSSVGRGTGGTEHVTTTR